MSKQIGASQTWPRWHRGRPVRLVPVLVGAGTLALLGAAVAQAGTWSPGAGGASGNVKAARVVLQSGQSGAGSRPAAAMGSAGGSGQVRLRGLSLRFRTIDDPADPTFNQLLGVNDSGRIVGYFGSGADAAHPNKGFRVRSPFTSFVKENVPASAQTQVVGINGRGLTVGFSVDAAGANTGFVDVNGHFTAVTDPLSDPAAPFNQLLGVNNNAIAVGFYNDRAGAAHGYRYNIYRGTFTPVHLPVTADAVTATGINDQGDISGFYLQGKTTFGFTLAHTGAFRSLSFGNRSNTQALGVNDADQVVGSYLDRAGAMHGFLLSRNGLTTIDDPNGAAGTVVNGLNNRGQLVGFYQDTAGLTHGFLATITH